MSRKTAIQVSEEVMKEIIHPYAKLRDMTVEDAVDRLLHIGASRHKALKRYSDGVNKAKAPKKPRAAKKATAAKKPRAGKKKKATPLAVAAGEAAAPAPVAEQELDDNFDPPAQPPASEPEAPVVEDVPVPGSPVAEAVAADVVEFDPFETYDANAPLDDERAADETEDLTQGQPIG